MELDLQRMQALGITPDLIRQALSQTNFIKSNGYLSDHNFLYLSVTDATVKTKTRPRKSGADQKGQQDG